MEETADDFSDHLVHSLQQLYLLQHIMKTFLTLLGAGIIGFIGGGIPGYLVGQPIGTEASTLNGVCDVADAAVLAKVLTLDQAEQLGKAVPLKISASEVAEFVKSIQDVGDGCKRSLEGVAQGAK
jgi:hypothetical protein